MNQLVVQTALIHVDAVEEDPAKHQAYDTAMTSYMLGVSRGYTYGGWAWVDETDNNGTIESDGIMQETEKKLEDVTVEMHEVDADGNIASKAAVDGDGNPAIFHTGDDGYYQFRLYPNKNYVAIAKYEGSESTPYKPSPFVLHNDPLEAADDNDLTKAVNNFAHGRSRPVCLMTQTSSRCLKMTDRPSRSTRAFLWDSWTAPVDLSDSGSGTMKTTTASGILLKRVSRV